MLAGSSEKIQESSGVVVSAEKENIAINMQLVISVSMLSRSIGNWSCCRYTRVALCRKRVAIRVCVGSEGRAQAQCVLATAIMEYKRHGSFTTVSFCLLLIVKTDLDIPQELPG